MSVRDCPDRWVSSLRSQTVTFTGSVNVDGKHLPRNECEREARAQGASTASDFSSRITLVVEGELHGKAVTDPSRGYSMKLVGAQASRVRGRPHVHVIDSDGFANLLDGLPARCRNLRGSGSGVRVQPEIGEGVLGGPLRPRAVVTHDALELTTDMSALDAGTQAHEATVAAFAAHLQRAGHIAQGPSRGAPLFDIGWHDGSNLFIGEVKSLRGTAEDQQIRLGIGQLLDYSHQFEARGQLVVPVLILQCQPTSDRWAALAAAHRLLLTYGPAFPNV